MAHVSRSYEEAEAWDLDYWLSLTPQERLSALVAIRRDVEKVLAAREPKQADKSNIESPRHREDARVLREVKKRREE